MEVIGSKIFLTSIVFLISSLIGIWSTDSTNGPNTIWETFLVIVFIVSGVGTVGSIVFLIWI